MVLAPRTAKLVGFKKHDVFLSKTTKVGQTINCRKYFEMNININIFENVFYSQSTKEQFYSVKVTYNCGLRMGSKVHINSADID